MRELVTRIEIAASPEKVWAALTDFSRYGEWNPFIYSASGSLQQNGKLTLGICPPGQRRMQVTVLIQKVVDCKELRWFGHFHSIPFLIDGEHIYEIQPLPNGGTEFIHRETFTGILVPFVWSRFLNVHVKNGFNLLNQSLRQHLERESNANRGA